MRSITGRDERKHRQRTLDKLHRKGLRRKIVVPVDDRPLLCPFRALGFADHYRYIKSGLWRRIRKCILQKFHGICACCSEPATTVHHLNYSVPTLLGEDIRYLVPLCRECHSNEHSLSPVGLLGKSV